MSTNLDPSELDIASTEEPEEEEQDLIRYEISSYPSDMTLQVYRDKWKAHQLITPEFQREYIWDQTRASKLIESFLLGLPVPGVFLYKERATKKLLIIDGQQRILSAIRFFEGHFNDQVFRLKNVCPKWEGKAFRDLSEPDQRDLDDTVLRATVVQQLDPNDNTSIYHIFERLNTGGVKLSPMEIRKCVYSGEFFKLLEYLNRNTSWRAILGKDHSDKRLRDVELVLRFLAMRDGWKDYEKPMKSFLNNYMIAKRELERGEIEKIGDMFERTCVNVIKHLGEKPFHFRSGALNPGLLDVIMVMMSLAKTSDVIASKKRFENLLSDRAFLDSIITRSTSDTLIVKQRFERARKAMLNPR